MMDFAPETPQEQQPQPECRIPAPPIVDSRGESTEELPERVRYYYRDQRVELFQSNLLILREIATFRAIRAEDLARHYFGNCTSKPGDPMPASIRWMESRGLIETRTVTQKNERRVEKVPILTITQEAAKVLNTTLRPAVRYSHRVRQRELLHDSSIYAMYQAKAGELLTQGARNLHPVPDFVLKQQLNSRLAKLKGLNERDQRTLKQLIASSFKLPLIKERFVLPDLRIEYTARDGSSGHADLELATPHYKARHLAHKAKAGFEMYSSADGKVSPFGPELIEEIMAL